MVSLAQEISKILSAKGKLEKMSQSAYGSIGKYKEDNVAKIWKALI